MGRLWLLEVDPIFIYAQYKLNLYQAKHYHLLHYPGRHCILCLAWG